jgi:hypothetical protein
MAAQRLHSEARSVLFQHLDPFAVAVGVTFTLPGIDFMGLDPGQQRLRRTANLSWD